MDQINIYTQSFGSLTSKTDIRDYKLNKKVIKGEELPEEFSLIPPNVKNQSSVGSCVAHAIAETIEYHNREQEHNNSLMSTGFIYGNRRNSINKKSGMYIRDALSNTCKYGDVYKTDFKENIEVPKAITLFEERFDKLKDKAYVHRFSSYFRLTSADEIKYALMKYGPVVFAIDWRDKCRIEKNILTFDTKSKKTGGHCMIIYGWNKDGWLIQNSWGTWFGNNGRVILSYDVKITEAWGITDEITSENSDIKKSEFNTTFKRFIAKLINWFINLFKK